MQIKNEGMRVEFCCEKMRDAVLANLIEIKPAEEEEGRYLVSIGQALLPMAGDLRLIYYCPYCPAEIVFEE